MKNGDPMAALLSARPQAAAAGAEYGQTGHRPVPEPDSHLSWRALALLALLTFAFLAPLFFAPVAYSTVDSDFDSDLAPYAAVRSDPGHWQWNAAYGLGQPVAADPLSGIFNPLAAGLLLGLSPERGLEPLLWCCLCLTAVVTWLLVRDFGCRQGAALFGALLFTWSGFVTAHLWAGHLEYALALPALPLSWLAGRRLVTRTPVGMAAGAVSVALPLLSGSVYIAEYASLVLATVVVCGALTRGWHTFIGRALPALGAAILLGAALAAIHLLPMLSLYGQLTRLPVDAAGSLPPWMLPLDLVTPLPLLALPAVQMFIEQQPARTVFWHELGAFVGPLALLPLGGLIPAWRARRGRPGLIQGCTVLAVGAAFLDGNLDVFPPHWLLLVLPQALASRVPARALIVVTLALAVLAAIGLDWLTGTGRPRQRRRWQATAVAGLVMLLLANELIIVGRAVTAANESLPKLSPAPRPAWLMAGEHVSQLALVEEGASILNDYYGWHLPAAQDSRALARLATAEVNVGSTLQASAAAVAQSTAPTLPLAYLTANDGCAGLACPVLRATTTKLWGGTTVVQASAGDHETLILAEAAVPGWRAHVDSGPWQTASTSGGVLTMAAVPGNHTYTFEYATPHFLAGAIISLVGLLIVIALLIRGATGAWASKEPVLTGGGR